jgi:hypothetical protein
VVGQLEAAQAVAGVGERRGERDAAFLELGGECVRVGHVHVGVPPGIVVAVMVRRWGDSHRLQHQLRPVPDDDREVRVRHRPEVGDVETEPVAVEGRRLLNVTHDEQRRGGAQGGTYRSRGRHGSPFTGGLLPA